MRRGMARCVLALGLVVVMAAPAGIASARSTVDIEQTHAWTAPEGAATYLEWTLDGSRLLVLGTGGPRTIQVLDRTLAPVVAVEAPFDVQGASWSQTGRWLVAWGAGDINGSLGFWDVPAFTPNATVVPPELFTIRTVAAARFFSSEEILVVAGKDANGTNRLNVVEVVYSRLHRDLPHPDNRTTNLIFDDGHGEGVLMEAGGYLRGFSGEAWNEWTYLGQLTGETTAQSIVWRGEWLAGDENGVVRRWFWFNGSVKYSIQLDRGPVQALAWMQLPNFHTVIAFPAEGGGSHLQFWREDIVWGEVGTGPFFVREYNFTSPITAMLPIPGADGNLTIGHADGSIANLRVNATQPSPPDDDGPPPPDPDDGKDEGPSLVRWWRDYGYVFVLGMLTIALAVMYIWLRRHRG